MNALIRLSSTVLALTLAAPALAGMDDWDARRVEVPGPDGTRHKLVRAFGETVVDVPPEDVWALLADFGAVQDYFPSIVESDWIGTPELGVGAARYCDLQFQGRDIHVKERIFAFEEGSWFTYDVYDWENFPLKRMHNTFGVRVDDEGRTRVYNIIDFKLKPAVMTGLARGQMQDNARRTVLGIKHILETGDRDFTPEELDEKYASRR